MPVSRSRVGPQMRSASFERLAGACAILTAIAAFLYAVAFVLLQEELLSALFLMVMGLLSTAVLVAVYGRLRETDASLALLALVLGVAGALGSAVHGGFDLANAVNPPASTLVKEIPNPIDPRGLLSFGVAGVALAASGRWLVGRTPHPRA